MTLVGPRWSGNSLVPWGRGPERVVVAEDAGHEGETLRESLPDGTDVPALAPLRNGRPAVEIAGQDHRHVLGGWQLSQLAERRRLLCEHLAEQAARATIVGFRAELEVASHNNAGEAQPPTPVARRTSMSSVPLTGGLPRLPALR